MSCTRGPRSYRAGVFSGRGHRAAGIAAAHARGTSTGEITMVGRVQRRLQSNPIEKRSAGHRSISMNTRLATLAGLASGFIVAGLASAADLVSKDAPAGWTTAAPREEIKPTFRYDPDGGRSGQAAFVITGDEREGTSGWWQKTLDVEGGKTYRF